MVVLVFLEKELQEPYLLKLKKAELPNLHNVHMYQRNHPPNWGYHIQTVAPLFTVNGTDGELTCNAGMFYWFGYLSQWATEFAETFSLPLIQDRAVPEGGRFLPNGEGICIVNQMPYNAFVFPSQQNAEAAARVLGCDLVIWLDRIDDSGLMSAFDGTLRQFMIWVNSTCLVVAQTPPGASRKIHDYIESIAGFLKRNLPPSVSLIRLPSPTDCGKEDCRDRTSYSKSPYSCCGIVEFRDCKTRCIDGDLFNQVISDYCSRAPLNITFDVSCWNWTFFCSAEFVPLERNPATRNCSVGFNQGHAYRSYIDLIQLGKTVLMPVFEDDRRFEQENINFFESAGFEVGKL
jgi:hypothetical protein